LLSPVYKLVLKYKVSWSQPEKVAINPVWFRSIHSHF